MAQLVADGSFNSTGDTEYSDLCNTYGKTSTIATLLGYLASVVIVLTNVFSGVLILALARFARFKNLSLKLKTLMNSQFGLMIINTCIITMAVTVRFYQRTPVSFDITPMYILNTFGG